ncbi:hypothetical protein CRE_14976 [Caenorhabditis remanei]|uniref:Uncharacterized protein n=1 Tax=Caenorhabditis remanei TaxID=31234 RepID=E3NF13_CAERE|nr:hypothetical protein CRE_14976 [Caenorhabditis remanei]
MGRGNVFLLKLIRSLLFRIYTKHGTIVENSVEAFRRLQNTTRCTKIHFILHAARIELSFLEELFSNFELQSWCKLSLAGREIEAESVNFVLNTPIFDKHFWFLNADMPVDFRHVNAFKFRSNDYEDARLARSPSRVYPLLAISYAFNLVILSAWRREEVFNSRYGDDFQKYENTYEKLKVLERKNTLEKEMELEETDSAGRRKMSKELEVLNEKIWRLGVFFLNGKAVTN